MDVITHSIALKDAEPGFFAVLYRAAAANCAVHAYPHQLERDSLDRLSRQLERLARPAKALANKAECFDFSLPEEMGGIQDFVKMTDLLVDRISELLMALDKNSFRNHSGLRQAVSIFVETRAQFSRLRQKWADTLERFMAVAPSPELTELLNQITPENRHAPTDWGKPVGREIW